MNDPVRAKRTRPSGMTLLALLLAALLCAAALTSCAGQDGSDQAGSDEDAASEDASAEDETAAEEDGEDTVEGMLIEDLISNKKAESATGIDGDEAGESYADGQVLVQVPANTSLSAVNAELAALEFIEEGELTEDMLISGSIQDETVVQGSIGRTVVLLHLADGVSVAQGVWGLGQRSLLTDAQPNYLVQASV